MKGKGWKKKAKEMAEEKMEEKDMGGKKGRKFALHDNPRSSRKD